MEWVTGEDSVGIFLMGEVSCLAYLFLASHCLSHLQCKSGSKKPKELVKDLSELVYRAMSV